MPHSLDTSRERLLTSTIDLVRAQGYASTRVEDICAAAGVTKGSFFHHFESKQDVAIAAARKWRTNAVDLFGNAPYLAASDPLERLLGYIDFRRELVSGQIPEWTCYAGTVIQEVHQTDPALRDASAESIEAHLGQLTALIEPVLAGRPVAGLRAGSLALHIQAVIQGAFVLAKGRQDPRVARECIDHLHRYVELLFSRSTRKKRSR